MLTEGRPASGAVTAWGWVVWTVSVLVACYLLVIGTAFWQVNCPGAAELSAQATVCGSVGNWGGPALMAVGLVLAAAVSALVMRRVRGEPAVRTTVVTAVALLPLLGPVAVYAGLTVPGDYCSAEEKREEQGAVDAPGATGGGDRLPDRCAAYEGDF